MMSLENICTERNVKNWPCSKSFRVPFFPASSARTKSVHQLEHIRLSRCELWYPDNRSGFFGPAVSRMFKNRFWCPVRLCVKWRERPMIRKADSRLGTACFKVHPKAVQRLRFTKRFPNGRRHSVAQFGCDYDRSRISGNFQSSKNSSLDLSRPRLNVCVYRPIRNFRSLAFGCALSVLITLAGLLFIFLTNG